MYIISKFKDYYDGVVGSVGMDKTIVYERYSDETNDKDLMPKEFQGSLRLGGNPLLNIGFTDIDNKKSHKYHDCQSFIIGFCGKLYIGWMFYYKEKLRHGYPETKCDIIYDFDIAKNYLREEYWNRNLIDDVKYVLDYDPIDIFRRYNAPIFVYDTMYMNRNSVFIVNPLLKKYEFYKVVDAFTAFTEIQMFISGVLGTGENDIVEIDDKYKIKKHGFDKWSFRREAKTKN